MDPTSPTLSLPFCVTTVVEHMEPREGAREGKGEEVGCGGERGECAEGGLLSSPAVTANEEEAAAAQRQRPSRRERAESQRPAGSPRVAARRRRMTYLTQLSAMPLPLSACLVYRSSLCRVFVGESIGRWRDQWSVTRGRWAMTRGRNGNGIIMGHTLRAFWKLYQWPPSKLVFSTAQANCFQRHFESS